MLRGALATAGAHEAALRDAVQEVLHPQGTTLMDAYRGHRRLYLGSVLPLRAAGLQRVAPALALSAQKPRVSPRPRGRQARHRDAEGRRESTG